MINIIQKININRQHSVWLVLSSPITSQQKEALPYLQEPASLILLMPEPSSSSRSLRNRRQYSS